MVLSSTFVSTVAELGGEEGDPVAEGSGDYRSVGGSGYCQVVDQTQWTVTVTLGRSTSVAVPARRMTLLHTTRGQ